MQLLLYYHQFQNKVPFFHPNQSTCSRSIRYDCITPFSELHSGKLLTLTRTTAVEMSGASKHQTVWESRAGESPEHIHKTILKIRKIAFTVI